MGQVVIRNIDDRVLERLKARARAQQKSLEQSLRDLLSDAVQPDRAALVREAERIRSMTPRQKKKVAYATAEELIREDRDTR